MVNAVVTSMITVLLATTVSAGEHPGKSSIEKSGYQGPQTCESCHAGTARKFLSSVHWKHASLVTNVDNISPTEEYGMKNRVYTMCNGNDIVNNLKGIPMPAGAVTVKYSGCNSCHPGDHLSDVGSVGEEAEQAIDCLVCHSTQYDFSKRKPHKDEKGRVVLGQDRSMQAALAIGKPTVKNCMTCHEAAGGGLFAKKGFDMTAANDVHLAKGMVCVDCHKAKGHRIPTGFDPNTWANDGLRIACSDCHTEQPHKDAVYNKHTAKIACQTCHIIRTGGAYAKDFTVWEKMSNGYFEPTTLRTEAKENLPVYAWYNKTVANTPKFVGPKGSRLDGKSKIYPFKVFQGKGFYDRKTGQLLPMDFGPPMSTGDTLAGVASATRLSGISGYEPVPGWQTLYIGSNHLVTRKKALACNNCHAPNGVLNFQELGYSAEETRKLRSAELYLDKLSKKQKDDW